MRYIESVPNYISDEDIPEKVIESDPYLLNGANPFLSACAGYWNAGGDAFLVYPGCRGEVLESIRLHALRKKIIDMILVKS